MNRLIAYELLIVCLNDQIAMLVCPLVSFLLKQVPICRRETWLRRTQISTHAFSKTPVKVVKQLENQIHWNGNGHLSNGPDH